MSASNDTPPALEADFAALRKLRDDDASGAIKKRFGDDEDPRKWKKDKYGNTIVKVADGRVTYLSLNGCTSLAALPEAIGELGALTELRLTSCWILVELPDAIFDLGALTTLCLHGCSSLVALPDAIGKLKALTELNLDSCTSLAELPAAIGELKALTELSLSECSGLTALPEAIGELGALTELNLSGCSNLATLPDSIGKLGALTTLTLGKGKYGVGSGCRSLVKLPDAIGELKALTELDLHGCSSLAALPDTIVGREGLTLELPVQLILGPLGEDFAALRKLRDDDASGAIREFFGDGEDPREWKSKYASAVTVKDGRVTELRLFNCTSLAALPDAIGELCALTELDLEGCYSLAELPGTIGELKALKVLRLYNCSSLAALPGAISGLGALTFLNFRDCSSLAALPDAIGGLGALTYLSLRDCSSLAALPDAIGELAALTELDLRGCSKLERLPDAIVGRDGLTMELPNQLVSGPLGEDFAALQKLRDDDASGALKEYFGEDEDPREWEDGGAQCVTVEDGRVTELNLSQCASLVALPAAIGELQALTKLNLSECSSLAALPDSIGGLGALTTLDLSECTSLAALPLTIHQLEALTRLNLRDCVALKFPPLGSAEMQVRPVELKKDESNLSDHTEGVGNLKWLCGFFLHVLDAINRNVSFDAAVSKVSKDSNDGEDLADESKQFVKDTFFNSIIDSAPFAKRLGDAVGRDPTLADLTNAEGKRVIDVACFECRSAMEKALMFLRRYEIADGPPEHRSATSLVVRALDYEAADDYGRLFDEFDDGDGTLDAEELDRLAAKLGTNVEILQLEDGSLTKDAFVAKCQRLFGKERKVVIKIFQVAEQWRNEKNARKNQGLDAQFVVQTIEAPGDDEFTKALGESALFKEDRFGKNVGTNAIVMDAADRNLFQIYQSERPDLNAVRVLMRQVMECVDHLHERGLVHGDIKMLNVVRLALDQKLRLIDLDAAAKISGDKANSYVGSKFSSAVLPPECFAKLDADQAKQFEAYFNDGDNAELWEKVAPKVDKNGASYVVKTFSLTKEGDPMTDGLPYEPVQASEAVDYWSLGALLFQLVAGEPLVPSNRDDDCVDADGMAKLASWEDRHMKRRLALLAEKDPSGKALDLALKLLVRDPHKRAELSIANVIKTHPFFNPQLMKDGNEELLKLVKEIKADTSSILRLSEENREELQLTRRVLLKAVFEATEVTTPTTFVVLNEKLPPPFTPKEKTWIETNVVFKDDGSGVEIKGKAPEWFADVEARLLDSMTVAKKGMDLAKDLAKFETNEVLTPGNFKSVIKRGIDHFFPTTTLYFYLVDELTGKPVRGAGYPIEITEPAEKLAQLLPVMQVGLHAMSAYNGVAGLVQMFGYPVPKVPEKWRTAAQGSVDLLKQDSSVAAFGVVHKKSKSKDKESSETVRGASLRELKQFFEKKDESQSYAGLRCIGDPADGTAIWTKVKDEDLEATLEARATERCAEEELRRKDIVENERSLDKEPNLTTRANTTQSVREGSAFVSNGGSGTTTTQPNSHEQNNAVLNEALVNALAKANGGNSGTCSGSCNCAIA